MSKPTITTILAAVFLVLLGVLVIFHRLPLSAFTYYLIISLIAFALYWHDKARAKKNQWRLQEQTLHFFGILGGWPGALVAQNILRHKSRKKQFQFTFWVTVVVNVVVLIWLVFYL